MSLDNFSLKALYQTRHCPVLMNHSSYIVLVLSSDADQYSKKAPISPYPLLCSSSHGSKPTS